MRPTIANIREAALRLTAADALVTAGCLDCLIEAYREYDALCAHPAAGDRATAGAIRAALLVAVREHDLGLIDSGYLTNARQMASRCDRYVPELSLLLDIGETLVATQSPQMRSAMSDTQASALLSISLNQIQWAELLRARASRDTLASYLWLSLACGVYRYFVPGGDDSAAVVGEQTDIPLVAFKNATDCRRGSIEVLERLLHSDPRFREIHYFLGLEKLGARQNSNATGGSPDLERADEHLRAAYEWRQDWPALTLLIAGNALAEEDYRRSLEFYDRTIALVPAHSEALLGRLRALTYLERHAEAIQAADPLIVLGSQIGQARYWRAVNETQLGRYEDAWSDIEAAARFVADAEVPKLAGIIAINRLQPYVARQRLELSLRRRQSDCETLYYLQLVISHIRDWEGAVHRAVESAACFDAEETRLENEVKHWEAANVAPVRRDRQIARREQRIATNALMRETAWFNAAAANYNLGRTEQSSRFALKLLDHPKFRLRALEILNGLTTR